MHFLVRPYLIFFLICLLSQTIYADDAAYVTDHFQISLRRGPTTEHKILRFISSGDPVEILEEKDGWSRIKTLDTDKTSISGWVLSRYLMQRPPYEREALSLREENLKIKKELSEIIEARKTEGSELKRLKTELSKTHAELERNQLSLRQLEEDSADYLDLRERCTEQKERYESMLDENIILRAKNRQQSLLIGGGLVLAGLFLGFIWGRREKNKHSNRLL